MQMKVRTSFQLGDIHCADNSISNFYQISYRKKERGIQCKTPQLLISTSSSRIHCLSLVHPLNVRVSPTNVVIKVIPPREPQSPIILVG